MENKSNSGKLLNNGSTLQKKTISLSAMLLAKAFRLPIAKDVDVKPLGSSIIEELAKKTLSDTHISAFIEESSDDSTDICDTLTQQDR